MHSLMTQKASSYLGPKPFISAPFNALKRDAPKPRGPLTTRQPAKDSWMSGNPTAHHHVPFSGTHDLTKIRQSLLCTGSSTQNATYTKNMATWPNIIQ